MTAIRFLHTDFFRLGTPVSGLAASPDWLKQLAAGASRQAVINLFDLAISEEVDFILIAGRPVDAIDDLKPAARWLQEQVTRLQAEGIQIVTVADDANRREIYQTFSDIVLHPNDRVEIRRDRDGLHFRSSPPSGSDANSLTVCISSASAPMPGTSLVYQAVPSTTPSADCTCVSRDGHLTLSAGSIQGVTPGETRPRGCVVVDADLNERVIRSQFHECDVIRFRTETVRLPSDQAPAIADILKYSDVSRSTIPQTVVVDWLLETHLHVSRHDLAHLSESELLKDARASMQAGHRGVWPRRISFTAGSALTFAGPTGVAEEAFMRTENTARGIENASLESEHSASAELIAGLTFLTNAA